MNLLALFVLVGLGLILVVYGVGKMLTIIQVRNWLRAKGVVASSTIKERIVRSRATWNEYSPDIAFSYDTLDGRKTSDKFSIDPNAFWNPERSHAVALKNKYPHGASVDVYVCPTDSSVAVLSVDWDPRRGSHLLAISIGGAIVLLAGIIGICFSVGGG